MKKIILLSSLILLFVVSLYAETNEEQVATDLPGKIVFSSNRTSDGRAYIYLLENGEIENLGMTGAMAVISPNGKYVACFTDIKELTIYDLEKRKIDKVYQIQYDQTAYLDWTRNGKYIIYSAQEELDKEKDLYNAYLMKIKIKNGKEKVLKKYENVSLWHTISGIAISNNGKRLAYEAGISGEYYDEEKMGKIYVMDLKGKHEKLIWRIGSVLGWYPDNKHILIHSSRNPDGSWVESKRGNLFKVDIDNLKFEVVEEVPNLYVSERLTRDGKYIYSARRFEELLTWHLVVGEVGKRSEEVMLTYPVPYNFGGITVYSDDTIADWWLEGRDDIRR